MDTKNYVVIGGGSGIGRNIVEQLYQKGHTVFVVSRNTHELPNDPRLIQIQCDVTNEDIPLAQFPQSLDGLVYCPGTIRLRPFNRLKDADFLEDFHVNTLGAVRAIRTLHIEASSPFPNRVYFILNMGHFLKRFETVEKMVEHLIWLPTWHQARQICTQLDIPLQTLWNRLSSENHTKNDLIILYEIMLEDLKKHHGK